MKAAFTLILVYHASKPVIVDNESTLPNRANHVKKMQLTSCAAQFPCCVTIVHRVISVTDAFVAEYLIETNDCYQIYVLSLLLLPRLSSTG